MNNALKGALLSGLGFPGLGQMILKHYKRGFALMFVVLGCLLIIVVQAIQRAFTIVGTITSGGAVDMNRITEAATQASITSESFIGKLAFFVIIVFWIIGIIDAYIIGKNKDNEERFTSQTPNLNDR